MFKKTLVVFLLNLFLFFSLFYITYKRYDVVHFGQGDLSYFELVKNPLNPQYLETPKERYRILTPLCVKMMRVIPVYHTEIQAKLAPQDQAIFFHYLLFNFVVLALVSALYFYVAQAHYGFSPGLSYLGTLLFLLSFHTVRSGFISIDAPLTHFFILLGLLCRQFEKWGWFVAVSVLGVLQKESVVLVLGIVFFLEFVFKHRTWNQVKWLLLLGIPTGVYVGFVHLFPVTTLGHDLSSGGLLANSLLVLDPRTYTLQFMVNAFLGYGTLLFCLGLHAVLAFKHKPIGASLWPLLAFPALLGVSMVLAIGGGNEGRVAFYAFPAYWLYQLQILKAFFHAYPDYDFLA